MMTTTPPNDNSFNKLLNRFEQCFLFLQFPDTSFIPDFWNNVNVSHLTGQITGQITGQLLEQTPDYRDDSTLLENPLENRDAGFQDPIYLSNFQPNLAVKETFMQNLFSPHNSTDPSLAVNSLATYGAVNQSPESRVSSEPSPINDIHRQKVVPISSTSASDVAEDARDLSAVYGELKLMSYQLSSLKADLQTTQANLQTTQANLQTTQANLQVARADLQVAQAEIQAVKQIGQRTQDHMVQFEQKQKQASIEQCKIRLAQDQQLERRLQQYVKDSVKTAIHMATERFLRVRGSVMPESVKQPSTYIVPNRLNTGIYS